jgi:PAS domain S-box-containing protein
VVSHLWVLSTDVVTAESRRRAYALTAEEEQAARAHASAASARAQVDVLRRLTTDNPRQQARLDRLGPLLESRFADIDASIEAERRAPADRLPQAAATAAAARANDTIRAVIAEMVAEESGLLVLRREERTASVQRTKWVIVLGSTAACLLVGAASLLLQRQSRQREDAEEELTRQESLYRTVLSEFPNGSVLLFDHDLRFRLAEGRGLAQVGLTKEAMEGRTIWECLPPETCTEVEPYYRAALAGRPCVFETSFRGACRSVQVSPVHDTSGRIAYGLLVSHDISERKRAEEAVVRLNGELALKVAEATAANAELEAFSYSVSHDLRAPIRHISGFVDLLQRRLAGSLDATAARHLETIARASQNMGQLIDDLLAFSRMGRTELMRTRVALGPLAREVVEGLKPEAEGRAVEWRINGLPEATGDPAMLRLVLGNLLSNALKYTRPRPQAVIEVGRVPGAADEVVVFVRDNGVGFDMKYADKLFGVFQRLHRSDEFDGTGIGLATVRRIVHRHGGRTWVQAAPDEGATFYIALPARAPENDA